MELRKHSEEWTRGYNSGYKQAQMDELRVELRDLKTMFDRYFEQVAATREYVDSTRVK